MYSIGQKVRLTKVGLRDKGYQIGDVITIGKTDEYYNGVDDSKGHYFSFGQLAPVFEIGDEVEIIEGSVNSVDGERGELIVIDNSSIPYLVSPGYWAKSVKLIRKGAGMARSLRDRIEALTGWDREAQYILDKVRGMNSIRILDYHNSSGYIDIVNLGQRVRASDESIKEFSYNSYDSFVRAFKDALLFLLDKSGLEKDTEKEELLKQIAELRTHHEQEGRNMKDLQQKHEAEGQRIEELERRIK